MIAEYVLKFAFGFMLNFLEALFLSIQEGFKGIDIGAEHKKAVGLKVFE
jgi:hypothetical protein